MEKEELKPLLKNEESELIERCESPDIKKISKAICAFANDLANVKKPGTIFIGVKDNGDYADIPVTDKILRNIACIKDNGTLQPFPTISVQKQTFDGYELAVVIVQPSKNPPMRYNGRCWVRTGPSVRQATLAEEENLTEKRQYSHLPYDMKVLQDPHLTIDDLNLEYFNTQYLPSSVSHEVFKTNNRDTKKQMQSLRLLDPNLKPTVTALLMMGKNPRNWFPGAYIQFIRFAGKELMDDVRDQKEISGTLPDQIQRMEDVLTANISKPLRLSDTQHIESPDYPIKALQQLIRNTVIHRNYESSTPTRVYWFDDRIEIHNPGGPFGELNVNNFGKGQTSYRNPTIAEALKNLNFIERFGFGIPLAKKTLKENGNPDLEFNVETSCIVAVVKKA